MNTMDKINDSLIEKAINAKKTKDGDNYSELPDFNTGDTINVAVRVVEGEKERIQNYKGIVISKHGGGISKTFIVRKVSNGIGVERIFPLYSPMIQSIAIISKGSTRKSKLYYLRGMSERKIRQKLK